MNGFIFAIQDENEVIFHEGKTFPEALREYADFKAAQASGKEDELAVAYILNPQGQRLVMQWCKEPVDNYIEKIRNEIVERNEYKPCSHSVDNQGFCFSCGILMNEDWAYQAGLHPDQLAKTE